MKTLILIRHAKACMPTMLQSDFDRDLETIGKWNAKSVAEKLFNENYFIEQIVSSNAKRTTQTAIIFAEKYNILESEIIFEEKLYNAPAFKYEDVVATLDNSKNIIAIVGHNMGISEYAGSLLREKMYLDMPPGSAIVFEADIQSWHEFENADKRLLIFEMP